jgi:UDP-2-acetamido-3-amino-2,3-dideoxy-glucuronate N-acetyltransferase
MMRCPESGYRYRETAPGVLRCLDLDDELPLPATLSTGTRSYRQHKEDARNERAIARS